MKNNVYPIITKKHSKNIWRKYIKCIEEYKLLKDGDIVFVPLNTKIYRFANEYLCKMLLTMSSEFKMYDIEVILGSDFSMIDKYNCNKVVLPDDFEDTADNTLWEMLYNGRISSYLPKEKVMSKEFLELLNNTEQAETQRKNIQTIDEKKYTVIRPLYLIHTEDILACHNEMISVTGECFDEISLPATPKRKELGYIRNIIDRLSSNNEAVGNNVFGSTVNVDADMLPAYWLKDQKYQFMEWYDELKSTCQ